MVHQHDAFLVTLGVMLRAGDVLLKVFGQGGPSTAGLGLCSPLVSAAAMDQGGKNSNICACLPHRTHRKLIIIYHKDRLRVVPDFTEINWIQ